VIPASPVRGPQKQIDGPRRGSTRVVHAWLVRSSGAKKVPGLVSFFGFFFNRIFLVPTTEKRPKNGRWKKQKKLATKVLFRKGTI
jgi:hypothetical protein